MDQVVIDRVRDKFMEKFVNDILGVQPMPSNLMSELWRSSTDYYIDETWMLIHGYKKVEEPFGHHGLLKVVSWQK